MKKSLIVALAGLLVATAMPASAQTYRSDARQYRQQERIDRGYNSGRISPREAARLDRQQRRIDRIERRARYYNNGQIDPRSADEIRRLQNRANRDIRRANRDGYRY